MWAVAKWPMSASRLAELVLFLVGLVAIASIALLVVAHLNDTYHIDHVAGAWLGLAKYVGSGVFYPPLYDGEHFGGTRYMPLQFLLYGAVGRLAGDYLVAPKVLSGLIFALLLGVLYGFIRGRGCPRGMTVALVGTVAVSFPGLFAATSTYGDALAVLFQLSAVALVARSTRPGTLAAAAGLCTLAVLTKFSALWAAAAIFLWVLRSKPGRALTFAAGYVGLTAASVWVLDLISGGQMLINLREFAFSGVSSATALWTEAPRKLYEIVRQRAVVELFVAPLALAAIVRETIDRRPSIGVLSLAFATPLLMMILADQGTDFNHLLDVIVLTAACGGEFIARCQSERRATKTLVVASVLIVGGVLASYHSNVFADTRAAAASIIRQRPESRFNRQLMATFIGPGENLLSEDASVPLLLGRTPIVLDAFMLRRIGDTHPNWRADLVRRLNEHRFDKIVLIFKLDLREGWWIDTHFGAQIATAIACNYHLNRELLAGVFKYRIYVPGRDSPLESCPSPAD
jgi:hypothetical protein